MIPDSQAADRSKSEQAGQGGPTGRADENLNPPGNDKAQIPEGFTGGNTRFNRVGKNLPRKVNQRFTI